VISGTYPSVKIVLPVLIALVLAALFAGCTIPGDPNATPGDILPSSGGQRFIDEQEAVRLVQETYPDLRAWPSEEWPALSIRTEPAPDGWYIAFIREGSGVPIISAQCYHVSHDRTVTPSGEVNRSIMVMTGDFSPKRCGCKE
jgi:hypothetical protein